MRFALTLSVLSVLALGAQSTSATSPESNSAATPSIDAVYDVMGSGGVLSIAAPDGTTFDAVDAQGTPVASGVVSGGQIQFYSDNAGPDQDGVLLRVFANGEVHMLTDTGYHDWWF